MRKKHTAPLLFLAALLVAAFAAPAANAAYWVSAGNPLVEPAEISFEGSINSGGFYSGYKCADVSGSMTLSPGDQGEITAISYGQCQGTGSYTGLSFAVTPIGLPWSVEAKNSYIHSDDILENVKYNGQNVWKEVSSSWDLFADNSEEISKVTINGDNHSAMGFYKGEFNFTPAKFLGIEE